MRLKPRLRRWLGLIYAFRRLKPQQRSSPPMNRGAFRPPFGKLFALICVGMTVVFGCAILSAIQSRSNITPNPAGESRTN
jgi:hypothetical protein